jgi:23S rRNA (cytosine1962-C5)-methyltransferase
VVPRQGRTHQIRLQLAAAGWPIVGDLEHGRPLPGGAPRMALHCAELRWDDERVACPPPPGWDALLEGPRSEAAPGSSERAPGGRPERPAKAAKGREAAAAGAAATGTRRALVVSRATARILGAGHPWVIADADTGPVDRLRAGEVVDLVDKGKPAARGFLAMAIVDPGAPVCARVVSTRRLRVLDDAGWRARAERALDARRALLEDPGTDALRLVHGEADGLPGIWVDRWGDCLVATRTARCSQAFWGPLVAVLAQRFPGVPLYQKDHWTDLRAADGAGGDALPGRWITPPAAGHPAASGSWVVREAGARFEVQPTGGLTMGLYPDQRSNRRLLAERVAGRQGLVAGNLFAHTGAFSVALALAGVARVYNVDLSPNYLGAYRTNLALNGLAEADHPAVSADAVRWLQSAPPLDVVVLDPPAFARDRGRGKGWNAQRDYAALVEAAARALATVEPGGLMLCCHNLRRAKKGWLRRQIDAGLARAGRKLVACEPAGPAPDFPTLKGFPEGHTFRGLLVTVA